MTKKNKILTAKDFLQKKKIIEENTNNLFTSKIFDGDIMVSEEIPPSEIMEIMSDDSLTEYEQYVRLVYTCCPIFKDEDFRQDLEMKEPYDVVKNVFKRTGAEVYELGNFILTLYGFLDADLVEKVKKQ